MTNSSCSLRLARVTRAFFLLFLPLLGTLQAQNGRPMVAANFVTHSGSHTYDITVMAIELPSGAVRGFLRLVDEFDDGTTTTVVNSYVGPVDELLVVGDTAFVRAGSTFLALTEDQPGAANPGGFTPAFFVSTPPPLGFVLPLFNVLPRIPLAQGHITVNG